MSSASRDISLYLKDIGDAVEKIEQFTEGLTFRSFAKDEKTIDAVIRNLEVIGEAAKHIPPKLRSAHPKIPWKSISGMRDTVVHEYFGVDLEIIWKTVRHDLPRLKRQVGKLLKSVGPHDILKKA